jgi:hypothetical protein
VAPKSAAEAKSDSLKAAVASKQAAQARSASKTPYLDATIAELYAHDSARGVLTAAICEEHGPQLRSVKEKNSRNNVFLAALEDLFITLEEAPSALRGCAGYIDNKESSVSLVDEPRSPNKMLRISPLGSYGVRFDIPHYGSDSVVSHVSQYTGTPVYVRVRSDSVSYSLTEKTSVEDFSLLKMALSRFAGTVINLTTLNGFVSK